MFGCTTTASDGTVTVDSGWLLRTFVPGQIAYDDARNAAATGDTAGAIANGAAVVANVAIAIATAGIVSEGTAVTNAAAQSAEAGTTAESVIKTTGHGAERIAGPNATRGGVLSEQGVSATRATGKVLTQADGGKVFVSQTANGKFNVAVQNGVTGKIVTTFENISQKSLDRLSNNYGWH